MENIFVPLETLLIALVPHLDLGGNAVKCWLTQRQKGGRKDEKEGKKRNRRTLHRAGIM